MLRIGDFSRLSQVSIKTLRYYDETGLLKPAEVDRFTGYRYYTLDQLPRLNRILALKDLGLALEQIARMLDDDLKTGEIRGMLRLKRSELQQEIEASQARLTRLDMRLRQIEMEDKMPDYEVILKKIEPQRVLSIRQIIPAVSGVSRLFDEVREAVRKQNIRQNGAWIALYHHAGYRDRDLDVEIAIPVDEAAPDELPMAGGQKLSIRVIPAIELAATALWHGSYNELGGVYTALNTYIHQHRHNYLGPAREIYLRGSGDTPDTADYLTEIQYPVGEFSTETIIDGVELPMGWKDTRSILAQHLPFTRRARTALDLAKIESVALQQSEINPVHILIGLLRESEGAAGQVLGGFGLTVEQMRTLAPHGQRQQQSTEPPVSDAARQVITYASEEAVRLGHDYTGTEHLLLALIRQRDDPVIQLLTAGGVTPEQVRTAVLQILNR
ncbi:MAG TPA: Clp protease N-terminal domain-containing protein [Phototrophicaceae bacterium]|nr:Clp protease N-terminal domain-containing protein [Phototrophicaceae bacterium]